MTRVIDSGKHGATRQFERGDAELAKANLSLKNHRQLQQYLVQHNLERDPFSDVGTRGLFFSGAGRKQAVDSLLHFSRYGTTPVFLTAPVGAGKSAVLQEFFSALESDVYLASIDVTFMLAPEQLFVALAEAFSLTLSVEESTDLSALADALLAFSRRQRAAEKQVLVCLDNVQDLSLDTLQALLALVAESEGELAMLLVGNATATVVLEAEAAVVGLLINRIELPPLERHDLASYLRYRLDSAGYRGDFPLTDIQLQALQRRSQDSLRQLNQLARSMLIATAEPPRHWRSPFPLMHSLILTVLFVALLYYWPAGAPLDQVVESNPITLLGGTDRPLLGNGSLDVEPEAPIVTERERNATLQSRIMEQRGRLSLPASVALASAGSAEVPPTKSLRVRESTEARARGEASYLSPRGVSESVSMREILLSWSQLGYALQVFGTHDAKRAFQLVDIYSTEIALLYYETRHNGKPWYVVVSGPYSGRPAAKEYIEQLPQELRRMRPWPRNIASIQADLRHYSAVVESDSRL